MATARHLGSTASSSNTSSYTHAITPNDGELLVVFAIATGTLDAGSCSGSATGSFTEVEDAIKGASDDQILRCYVSDALSDGSAEVITYDVTGDDATGGIVSVYGVSGMGSNVGALAVRQTGDDSNNPSGTEPVVVMPAACLDTNVVLVAAANNAGVGFDGVNPTSSVVTQDDIDNFTSPTTALVVYSADSGETLDTFTWADGVSGGQSCAIVIELDVPAAGDEVDAALLQVTPTLPVASLRTGLTAQLLQATPTLPAAEIEHALTAQLLQIVPTLPAAEIEQAIQALLLELTPQLPPATITEVGGPQDVVAVLLQATPTLPAASLRTSLAAQLLQVTPTLPAASIEHGLAAQLLQVTPTLPAASLRIDLAAQLLQIVPTLPAASLLTQLTAETLSVTPELPPGLVADEGAPTQVLAVTLEATPALPAASLLLELTAQLLQVNPELPPATIVVAQEIEAQLLQLVPTLPAATVQTSVELEAETLQLFPLFPAAQVVHMTGGREGWEVSYGAMSIPGIGRNRRRRQVGYRNPPGGRVIT